MKKSPSLRMRLLFFLAAIAVSAALLIWNSSTRVSGENQNQPKQREKRAITNYDIRDEKTAKENLMRKRGLTTTARDKARVNLGQTMKAARERLLRQMPNAEVEWNPRTNGPEIVGVLNAERKLTGRSSAGGEQIVRDFVSAHRDLYGLTANEVSQLKTTASYTNPNGNMSWVEVEQRLGTIPVFQGNLRAGLTKDGELVRTTGLLLPGLDAGGTSSPKIAATQLAESSPAQSAADAVAAGAASIGVKLDPASLVLKGVSDDGTEVTFSGGPFVEDIKASLVYFPLDSGAVTLSWSMTLWEDNPAYYTLVDAGSGELLWRKNITNDQTQPVTYSIYNDDSPGPLSPFVGLPGSNIQGPCISRTEVTEISELPAFDNLGWITDSGTTTTGNNVDAGVDLVSPNGIDAGGRPVSPTRVFNYSYNPAPCGSDAPTGTDYRSGAVTNLFFWSNRYHDILYQYGFTEAARNFQQNNFGRGGVGNDFVRAEAQDFSGTNNANFSTPADGSLPRMQMFVWPGPSPARDGDLDQTVSLHELTHGTSNRLHNNAAGLNAVISQGMGEGWSDFYARMILSSADEDVDGIFGTGQYATYLATAGYTDNYYDAIRRFPSAVKTNVGPNGKPHNPLTLADIDPNLIDLTDGAYPRGPFGVGGDAGAVAVHNIGEVWSIALIEVRARIIHRLGYAAGNARMLQLTTDAMKLDPVNPTHLIGRNSFLAADVAFGSEDALDIWAGFATRGMGFGATISPQAQNTSGIRIQNVVESFDNPIPGMGAVSVADNACNSNGKPDVGETLALTIPLTNPLPFTITDVSAQVVGGGSASYGTITPGATVTQTISYLVPANVPCGSKVTVSVIVTSNLGTETKTFKIKLGSPTPVYTENFDGVAAPALPAGWSTANSGAMPLWVTSTTAADSAPNAASVTFPASTASSELVSPAVAVPATGAQLTFRHGYNSEFSWDGGVLEISINGGAFTDIVDAGGTFETGSYNWAFNRTADGNTSVLQGRAGWTGSSGGFITSTVNLPPAAFGQSVRFKFRAASDSSTTVAGSFWRIDSIVLNGFICQSVATTTSAAAASGQYSDSTTLSATLSSDCDYPEGSMEFRVDGNLVGTTTVSGTGTYSVSYTITNAAGAHTIAANFVSSNPYFGNSGGTNTLTVSKEDAIVTPSGSNPMAVQVSSPGGTAASFMLQAAINEVADGSLGDISNAAPVSMMLSPLAPGSAINCAAATLSGGGVGGTLTAKCTFTNVPVNVYEVAITIGGNYYMGSGETVVTVFDPSLGFVTGGGTILHNGARANLGFNIKYKKNASPQGQLLYIEHRPTGDVLVRGNVMQSLAIVGNTAVFTGKGPVNGVGNYSFRVTIIDNGEPGSSDQFGLQLNAPGGAIVSDMTFSPLTLTGGNIQVPK